MKYLLIGAAFAALALNTQAAAAADLQAAPPLPAFDWTGFHFGLGVGGNYAFSQQNGDVYLNETYKNESADLLRLNLANDGGDAGFMGTAELGYDYQIDPSMVIGLLANYDFGKEHIDSGLGLTTDLASIGAGASMSTEVGDSWAIAARVGYLPLERTMIYVLGGFTQANVHQNGAIYADLGSYYGLGGGDSFREGVGGSGWQNGWLVGAGIETMLGDTNWSLKGEYRYADYGSLSSHREVPIYAYDEGGANIGGDRSDSVTVHSVRAVLSYRLPM